MTTKTAESLEVKIERLVREHLAEQQQSARAAIERVFAKTKPAPVAAPRQGTAVPRRTPEELGELAEQLLEAVRACPGETMPVIAAQVGEEPRALHRPMQRLKRSGRVRSAGERNFTRYFPMAAKPA